MKNLILIAIFSFASLQNVSAQKFVKVASLDDRGEGSVFIANDTVYFLCGLKVNDQFNLGNQMFDANTWKFLGSSGGINSLSDFSQKRKGATAFYNESLQTMYLIGGKNDFAVVYSIDAYSLKSQKWDDDYAIEDYYSQREGHNAFVNNEGLYLFGGGMYNVFDDHWVFAPKNKEYKLKSTFANTYLERRRHSAGVANGDGEFFMAGGYAYDTLWEPVSTLVRFNTMTKTSDLVMTDDVFKNYGGKAFKLGKYLYFFSGNLKSTMIKYDPTNNTFEELPNTLDPTKKYYGGVSFTYNGKVYFGSGYVEDENGNVSFLNDLYEVTEAVGTSNTELDDYTINYLMDEKLVSIGSPNTNQKQVEVYDSNGRILIQTEFNNFGTQISLQGLVPGVYVVKLSASSGQFITKRVIVPR